MTFYYTLFAEFHTQKICAVNEHRINSENTHNWKHRNLVKYGHKKTS